MKVRAPMIEINGHPYFSLEYITKSLRGTAGAVRATEPKNPGPRTTATAEALEIAAEQFEKAAAKAVEVADGG